jgi:epoxide hydrolase-like predicted phosphatase
MKRKKGTGAVRAVIFDLGGVVVAEADPYAYKELARFFGTGVETVKRAIKNHTTPYSEGRINDREFYRRLSGELGARKKPYAGYRSIMIGTYLRWAKVNPAIMRMVRSLRKNYLAVGLTNTFAIHEMLNVRRKLFRPFDHVFRSNRIHMVKPYYMKGLKDPTMVYEYVCGRIRIPPEKCVFIDDFRENLVPARMIGMKTIHFRNAGQLGEELRKLGIRF